MRVLVFVYPLSENIKSFFEIKKTDYIIAVDSAVEILIKQNITPNLAVGDFDSLSDHSLLSNIKTVKLAEIKDETDSFVAIEEAFKLTDDVIMIGGFCGERIEHFIAHLLLFNKFPKLIIMSENSVVKLLEKGVYNIQTQNYISLFSYEESLINLKGFKYNLENYLLKPYDPLCISNEVIDKGTIEVVRGKILYIESKK